MKKILLFVSLFVIGFALIFVSVKKSYFFSGDVMLDSTSVSLLTALGDSALAHRDVPVAAILLYNDSIIGVGYNTVIAEGNAGGHAEINALSVALKRLGKRHSTV